MLEYSVYCTDYFSSWQGQIVQTCLRGKTFSKSKLRLRQGLIPAHQLRDTSAFAGISGITFLDAVSR